MELRDWLNLALDSILYLESGHTLSGAPIQDPYQRAELTRAKFHILKALEQEGIDSENARILCRVQAEADNLNSL